MADLEWILNALVNACILLALACAVYIFANNITEKQDKEDEHENMYNGGDDDER